MFQPDVNQINFNKTYIDFYISLSRQTKGLYLTIDETHRNPNTG